MKTAGIIAEYNPFHRGHQYQISQTRAQTGAEYVIVVMSGDFVQRGAPAFLDKYLRARMALCGGADLVLELPAAFSVGSAEDFSRGAVSLLHKLHTVDVLSFGSECGETALLQQCADLLHTESSAFQELLQRSLKNGDTFPAARAKALTALGLPQRVCEAAASPNNLLGIEYLRALRYFNARFRPVTIRRTGYGYHDPLSAAAAELSDTEVEADAEYRAADAEYRAADAEYRAAADGRQAYASASGIRKAIQSAVSASHPISDVSERAASAPLLFSGLPEQIRQLFPDEVLPCLSHNQLLPLFPDDCSDLLNYRIALAISDPADPAAASALRGISDFSPDLANRLSRSPFVPESFEKRIAALKTRQYTYTRISRALTHLLLQITDQDMALLRSQGYASYARVLGFRKSAAPLLKHLAEVSELPLITKPASQTPSFTGAAAVSWALDVRAANIYETLVHQKYRTASLQNEYSRPLIIL